MALKYIHKTIKFHVFNLHFFDFSFTVLFEILYFSKVNSQFEDFDHCHIGSLKLKITNFHRHFPPFSKFIFNFHTKPENLFKLAKILAQNLFSFLVFCNLHEKIFVKKKFLLIVPDSPVIDTDWRLDHAKNAKKNEAKSWIPLN